MIPAQQDQNEYMAKLLSNTPIGMRNLDPGSLLEENYNSTFGPRGDEDMPWNKPAPASRGSAALFGVPMSQLQHMAGDVVPLPIQPTPQPGSLNSRLQAPNYATGRYNDPQVIPIGRDMFNEWAARAAARSMQNK